MILGLMIVLVIGCTPSENEGTDPGDKSELAAIVNGVGISIEEFENSVDRTKTSYEQQGYNFEGDEGAALLEQIRQQAIDELVQQEVLIQNAEEKGYEVSEEQVNAELEQIKVQFPSDEDYQTALEQSKLTEDELKSLIVSELQIEQFVKNEIPEVTVTDEEIQQLYDQYKIQYEAEGTEQDQDFPSFEEAKPDIEVQIKQQKEQEQFGQLMEELMAKSDIEILI